MGPIMTSASNVGAASSTWWPSEARSSAVSRTAATHSGSTAVPSGAWSDQAIRRRPGLLPTSSRYGRSGGMAKYGSPATGPAMTSSRAALSRTVRVIAWRTLKPPISSPAGARDTRPRLGLRPKTPQHDAGMRIEPAPSPPLAAGTMPAATAAAEPPEDPPTVRSRSQGFSVGPNRTGSVVEWLPNSGVLVRPTMRRPADR